MWDSSLRIFAHEEIQVFPCLSINWKIGLGWKIRWRRIFPSSLGFRCPGAARGHL